MGKITSKCCKPCEANDEMGNANLDQTRNLVDNNANSYSNKGFSFSGDEKQRESKAKANSKMQKENLDSFIEQHKRIFKNLNF